MIDCSFASHVGESLLGSREGDSLMITSGTAIDNAASGPNTHSVIPWPGPSSTALSSSTPS